MASEAIFPGQTLYRAKLDKFYDDWLLRCIDSLLDKGMDEDDIQMVLVEVKQAWPELRARAMEEFRRG